MFKLPPFAEYPFSNSKDERDENCTTEEDETILPWFDHFGSILP
jgi:hypothetical protein